MAESVTAGEWCWPEEKVGAGWRRRQFRIDRQTRHIGHYAYQCYACRARRTESNRLQWSHKTLYARFSAHLATLGQASVGREAVWGRWRVFMSVSVNVYVCLLSTILLYFWCMFICMLSQRNYWVCAHSNITPRRQNSSCCHHYHHHWRQSHSPLSAAVGPTAIVHRIANTIRVADGAVRRTHTHTQTHSVHSVGTRRNWCWRAQATL